jgi:uncharacterized protein YodC (DUF2158 family)
MATELKVGDIVQLKSGGPEMTVTHVGDAIDRNRIHTAWFAGKKNEKSVFPSEALELVEEDE